MTVGDVSQHLVSHYKIKDVQNGRVRSPSSLELVSFDISPENLDKTHFRKPPNVEIFVKLAPTVFQATVTWNLKAFLLLSHNHC